MLLYDISAIHVYFGSNKEHFCDTVLHICDIILYDLRTSLLRFRNRAFTVLVLPPLVGRSLPPLGGERPLRLEALELLYIHIYIYMCIYIYMFIYVYICMYIIV